MPEQIYFDVDAFRFMGTACRGRPLPLHLRRQIVIDPLTAIEVLAQLCTPEAGVILQQIQAVRNWIDPEHAAILPWMDDVIAVRGFGIVPDYSDITDRVGNAIQICLRAERAADVAGAAQEVRLLLDEVKDGAVQAFAPLIDAYRAGPRDFDGIDQAWFAHLKRRARVAETPRTVAEAINIFEAFYRFEMARLEEAARNPEYNAGRRRNDALDVQHLIYLSVPNLHFLTCDRGYVRRLQGACQLARITTSTPEQLRDPAAAELLLQRLIEAE